MRAISRYVVLRPRKFSPPPVALSGVFPMRGGENIEYFLFHARIVIR